MTQQTPLTETLKLIDEANSKDPNQQCDASGKAWPKELLYSYRMTDMLERYQTEPDEVAQIFSRAQHIQRWMSPRSDYTMDRKGYHQWRTALYTYHADTACELMQQAGYDEQKITRVRLAVSKKSIKRNPDSQLLEDISSLVFIEHYILAFVEKHPEYDEEKWIDIVRKTWHKMSDSAHAFALSGKLVLPESLIPLIQKAVT